MDWPHLIVVEGQPTGSTPGTQDEITSVWTPGTGASTERVYEDDGDLQDSGRAVVRSVGGPVTNADAVVFLRDESKIINIVSGMTGTVMDKVTGRVRDFEVDRVNEMEGSFLARFV